MKYPNQMNYPPMQQTNPPFVDPSMWTPWPPQQKNHIKTNGIQIGEDKNSPSQINYLNHNFYNHSPYHQVLHQTIK
jgi:hypothetical protein